MIKNVYRTILWWLKLLGVIIVLLISIGIITDLAETNLAETNKSIGFILFGLLLFGYGGGLIRYQTLLSRDGYNTEGEVIEIVCEWVSGDYMYSPIIRFKDPDNRELDLQLQYGCSISVYSVRDIVSITYYDNKIYPNGHGWKSFRVIIALIGIGIVGYHLLG